MKYTLNVLLIFICNFSIAQDVPSLPDESLDMVKNIVKILTEVKNGHSEVLNDINVFNINIIAEVNRKKYPELWRQQTTEKVKLYLYTLNELSNYIDYNEQKVIEYPKFIIPSCFKDTSFIQYVHQPSVEEIDDEECKNIFLKMLKDREELKKKNEYLRPIYTKYSRLTQDLVTMFEWSEYSSVKEIDKFLRPLEAQFFDKPKKTEYFRMVLSHFTYNKN